MTLLTVDHPSTRPETSLPSHRENGQTSTAMSPEERERWLWQTRLRQLVMDETRALKRLAWGAGIYFGLLLLMPLGVWIAGGAVFDHMVGDRPAGARVVGTIFQFVSGAAFWLLLIPLLLRFVRWIEAMWRRRRFSSTQGANAGQLR
jgi:hypothetical protein